MADSFDLLSAVKRTVIPKPHNSGFCFIHRCISQFSPTMYCLTQSPQTFIPFQRASPASPSVRCQQKAFCTCCLDILPVQAFSVQNPIDPVFKVQCRLRAFSQVGTIHNSKAVLERRGFQPRIFDNCLLLTRKTVSPLKHCFILSFDSSGGICRYNVAL